MTGEQLNSSTKYLLYALGMRASDFVPLQQEAQHLFQKYITRSLKPGDRTRQRMTTEWKHLHPLVDQNISLNNLQCLQFGAGYDLLGPIAFYMFGIDNQTVLDLRSLIRFEVVNNLVRALHEWRHDLEEQFQHPMRDPGSTEVRNTNDLLERFGIDYRAPSDARDTQLPEGSFDFISTTSTLEHIPDQDLKLVLKEAYRLLRPGAYSSHIWDMTDHYQHKINSVSQFHFLHFQSGVWDRFLNCRYIYQNRMRNPEYLAILKDVGYEIVEEENQLAGAEEIEKLKRLRIAENFSHLPLDVLSIRNTRALVRKPGG